MSDPVKVDDIEEIEEIVADNEDVIEDVSEKDTEEIEEGSFEESEQEEEGLVSHLYELLTNSQGVNVTEAMIRISENLEKTNKILYKMLQIMSQHMSK